jgi:hypothetical protein
MPATMLAAQLAQACSPDEYALRYVQTALPAYSHMIGTRFHAFPLPSHHRKSCNTAPGTPMRFERSDKMCRATRS